MQEVTRLTVEILKCPVESVDVIFIEIPPTEWAHGGKFYAQPRRASARPASGCQAAAAPRHGKIDGFRPWRRRAHRGFPMSSPKVGFVSLGCPKALVDSERILTQLRTEGYEVTPEYNDADVVVVNTCGFIDSAKAESLEAIGEAIAENGKVIVTGCMGVEESVIRQVHPSVLAVTGPQQYEEVVRAVHGVAPPRQDHNPYLTWSRRKASS